MSATFIDAGLVVLGSLLGLLCKAHISERFSSAVIHTLALCVLAIGASMAIGTQDTLCMVVCLVLGVMVGEALDIERRLDAAGELLKRKLVRGGDGGRFTEGFVTATILYCVGALSITGAIEAGLDHNYTILISKGVIDGVSAVTFVATMGIGAMFAVFPLIVYQGAITLLASLVGPFLSQSVVREMSAVGGVAILGLGLNMLQLVKPKIKVANLLPALFLPIAYVPLSAWLAGLAR